MSKKNTKKPEIICAVYKINEDGKAILIAEYTADDDAAFEAIEVIKGSTESMMEYYQNTSVLE